MSSKYYFIASLPALEFGGSVPMTSQEFLENSAAWLSESEIKLLQAIENGQIKAGAHPATDQLLAWQDSFGNAILNVRAAKLNKDSQPFAQGTAVASSFVRGMVSEILKNANPLEVEKGIDEMRWGFLEELCSLHQFDIYNIISYLLQIKINQRWLALDENLGKEMLEKSLTPDN